MIWIWLNPLPDGPLDFPPPDGGHLNNPPVYLSHVGPPSEVLGGAMAVLALP